MNDSKFFIGDEILSNIYKFVLNFSKSDESKKNSPIEILISNSFVIVICLDDIGIIPGSQPLMNNLSSIAS